MPFAYKPKHSKTWRIGFYDEITGKRKSISARTRLEAEAKRIAKKMTAERHLHIRSQELIPAAERAMTLSAAEKLFLGHKNISDGTKQIYHQALKHLRAAIGDKPLYRITNTDYLKLMQFLNERRFTPPGTDKPRALAINAKSAYLRSLHSFFQWLLENKFIEENYIKKIKSEKKETITISADHLEAIFADLKKTNAEQYSIIKITYLAALRAGEVIALSAQDIDFQKKILTVSNQKGGRRDKIPIPEDLINHFADIKIPRSGKLFPQLTYNAMKAFWSRSMIRLGFPYNLHLLRKTRGTQLAEAGVSTFFLKEFMRHKSITTTEQFYINVNIEKARQEIDNKLRRL